MVQTISKAENYRCYIRFILRMYELFDQGKFESEEADVAREEIEGVWDTLSKIEQARLRGLSLDLNYIREAKRSCEGPTERGRDKLVAAANLRDKGEPDRALELLRKFQNDIYPPVLSFLRGRIWWMGLDVPEVAVEFLRDAWQLDKANQQFQAMYLQVLRQANLPEAKKLADSIVAAPEKHQVILLAFAIEALCASIDENSADAKEQYARMVLLLETAIKRMGEPPIISPVLIPPVLSMCVVLLAENYEKLGRIAEADDALTYAMTIEGDSPVLFASRGKLRYPKEEGVRDLWTAIQLGFPAVWPYLWVAQYFLEHGRYRDCLQICEAGMVRKTTAQIKSELLGLAAIAKACLAYSSEEVRRQFKLAIETDASNARAKHNLEVFELAMGKAVQNEAPQYKWTRIPERVFCEGREEGEGEAVRPTTPRHPRTFSSVIPPAHQSWLPTGRLPCVAVPTSCQMLLQKPKWLKPTGVSRTFDHGHGTWPAPGAGVRNYEERQIKNAGRCKPSL